MTVFLGLFLVTSRFQCILTLLPLKLAPLGSVWGVEVCTEVTDTFPAEVTGNFKKAWLEYHHLFNERTEEKI